MIYSNTIGACFLYTKKIANKIGEYNTNLFLVEDYDYWMRIFLNGKISAINEVLYTYRMHSKSLTATRKEEVRKVLKEYQFSQISNFEKHKIPKLTLFRFFEHLTKYFDSEKDVNSFRKQMTHRHPLYFWFRILKKIKHIFKK